MQEEYKSLLKKYTWYLVPLHSRRKLVICIWVYKTKRREDRHISRYKDKLVSNDSQQVHGIDYDDTFALVVKMDSR
jgi:hypothetical protein